jgi:amidase
MGRRASILRVCLGSGGEIAAEGLRRNGWGHYDACETPVIVRLSTRSGDGGADAFVDGGGAGDDGAGGCAAAGAANDSGAIATAKGESIRLLGANYPPIDLTPGGPAWHKAGPFAARPLPACTIVSSADALAEADIPTLKARLGGEEITSECLTAALARRIEVRDVGVRDATPFIDHPGVDDAGWRETIAGIDGAPGLHAVIAANPHVFADARNSDAKRKAGKPLGPLEGIPILLKDNIESWDDTATTAGSLALAQNRPQRDAPLVRRLTDAGALILGKTNLSEWANFRSSRSLSGWSAVGGQVRNPYALDRSPCGSSSGSAVAVAAGYAPAAIGTETDGSITCPAAVNGIVGLKPTVGLISRTGVVPISVTQDTPGPMTRTVMDAALMLNVLAGSDPADAATAEADRHRIDYAKGLDADSLKGARIGVMRFAASFHPETEAVFNRALEVLKARGAILVEITSPPPHRAEIGAKETLILNTEFKVGVAAYLASTDPATVASRTLADLIAFNRDHAAEEMPFFAQEVFEKSETTLGLADPAYLAAKADAHRWAGPEGIDAMVAANDVVALVAPTLGPAWPIDPALRDRFVGGGAGSLAAVAGYPHLTVPMGAVCGLPVGLSFIGAAWSEGRLLSLGYAYEQASHMRRPPTFAATVTGC